LVGEGPFGSVRKGNVNMAKFLGRNIYTTEKGGTQLGLLNRVTSWPYTKGLSSFRERGKNGKYRKKKK